MTDPNSRAASLRRFAFLGLGAVLIALATGLAAEPPAAAPKGAKETLVGGLPLFANWPKGQKPDAVLVLSGQTFGYLQPCGCSRPQTGGLERRAVFIDSLKAKGWPVAGVDLGDLYPEKVAVREQGRLKYVATMNALREMGYVAVGVGQTELAAQLDMLLGAYAVQKEQPPFSLAGNAVGIGGTDKNGKPALIPRLERFPVIPGFTRPLVGATEVAEVGQVPVGIAGIVGSPLAVTAREAKLDTSIDFGPPDPALKEAAAELAKHAKKPQLNVLIFQGSATDAEKIAKNFPTFNVILCQASDALPPQFPKTVDAGNGKTVIVEVGHKGQHVGVLGVFKKPGGGFDLNYQLVPMGEEYNTPGTDEQAVKANKTLAILEDYAKAVKTEIVLGKDYPRTPHPAQIHAQGLNPKVELKYVGSDACKDCHAGEFAKWKTASHSHAIDALEKLAKRPSLRQFDGECVKCHVVGFEHQTGYEDEVKTKHLQNVGCESCHGPGSGHAADPKNKHLTELLSLWKQGIPAGTKMPDSAFMEKMAKLGPSERGMEKMQPAVQLLVNRVAGACMKCHDQDSDPHFDIYKYWQKIGHSGLAPAGGWPVVPPKK